MSCSDGVNICSSPTNPRAGDQSGARPREASSISTQTRLEREGRTSQESCRRKTLVVIAGLGRGEGGAGLEGGGPLMRTCGGGRPDERMRAGGSEVGSVCPNWLTEPLKYPCSNYSHKEHLLAIERSHWATFVHTGRQQTAEFLFV